MAVEKEPWDLDAFVRTYNEFAARCNGWPWDLDDPRTARLPEMYAVTPWSLREFAEARFMSDQQY